MAMTRTGSGLGSVHRDGVARQMRDAKEPAMASSKASDPVDGFGDGGISATMGRRVNARANPLRQAPHRIVRGSAARDPMAYDALHETVHVGQPHQTIGYT
jgi:hypothetical protein